MMPRLEPRSRIVTVIVSLALVLAAITTVVVVQRRRARAGAAGNTGSAMTNMPGMSTMPGMTGTSGTSQGSSSTITVSTSQQRALEMSFGTVDMRPLVTDTRATGVVTFDEGRIAQVTPKFNGFAERVYVNATGQPVARGEPLLDVYSPDVLAAEQELLLAERLQRDVGQTAIPGVPANTTDLVAAARRRLELWDISPAQIDEVLHSGRARRTFTLYSPASGVVVAKNVVQGQSVTNGQSLYTIADLADVWIDVQLRESDAAAARIGAGADIEITGLAGRAFKGQVAYVYPTLDTTSRAVRARVVVSNADRRLMPGMYATVRLRTTSRSALTVPTSAVLRTGTRNVVFVDLGGGRLMPVEIETGQLAGDLTEVLAGLEPGQRVVTSAQFLLDSESNLAEVMRSMISQMPSGSSSAR
jgi:membrane fusion protein, copper/silver efflux system